MSELKYKVGDKVRIKSLDWYRKYANKDGIVVCGNYYFTQNLLKYCGKILMITNVIRDFYVCKDIDYQFSDEMIEGLVEEATEPELKFKVGDKVITDTNMKGKIIEVVEEGWYRVEFEPCNGIPQPNGVVPEESMSLVEEETKPKFKVGDKDNDFYMNYEESEDYITKRGFDIPWNDCDVFVDEREIGRTVGNVLKWADKTMIEKAWDWFYNMALDYMSGDITDVKWGSMKEDFFKTMEE